MTPCHGPQFEWVVSACVASFSESRKQRRLRGFAEPHQRPRQRQRGAFHRQAGLATASQAASLTAGVVGGYNAEAILFDYQELGAALWDRFNGGAEGTRWYYSELARCFTKLVPGRLSDRLSRAVQAFSKA
jgi:hypothetical protein